MKKFLALLALFAFANLAIAQSTSPRFSTTKNGDNTGRVLVYNYAPITFANVLYETPNAFETTYKIGTLTHALTDSMSVTKAHVCDLVTFLFLCDTLTAGRVVTFGTNLKSAGTLTVAKNKRASATFVFDGVYWVERSRAKE